MEMSALFTLNELDRTIGDFRVGLAVQRHPDRKTARGVFSKGGVLQDLAIGGENRDSLIALVWLNPDRARQHATGVVGTASAENLAADPGVHHYIHRVLHEHNRAAGSCDRISAVAIQTELPSLAAGETTDKAYIHQPAVL